MKRGLAFISLLIHSFVLSPSATAWNGQKGLPPESIESYTTLNTTPTPQPAAENDPLYDSVYLAGDAQWIDTWTGGSCELNAKSVGVSLQGNDSDKKGDIFYGVSSNAPTLKGKLIQTPKDAKGDCVLFYNSDNGARHMGIVQFENDILGMPPLLFKGKVPQHLEFGKIFDRSDPITAKAGELIKADVGKRFDEKPNLTGSLQRIVIPGQSDLLLNTFSQDDLKRTFAYALESSGPKFLWDDQWNATTVSLVMRINPKSEWVLLEKMSGKATSAEVLTAIDSKKQRRTVKGFLYGGC